MDVQNPKIAELEQLLWRMRDGAIDDKGLERIESLVTGDADVRRYYIRYSTLCGGLRWLNAGDWERGSVGFGVGDSGRGVGDSGFGVGELGLGIRGSGFGVQSDVGAAVELPHRLELESRSRVPNPEPRYSSLPSPLSPPPSPLLSSAGRCSPTWSRRLCWA